MATEMKRSAGAADRIEELLGDDARDPSGSQNDDHSQRTDLFTRT